MQSKEEIVAAFDKVIRDVTEARENFIADKPIGVYGPARDLNKIDDELSLRDIKAALPMVEKIELDSQPESCDDGTFVNCLENVKLITGEKSFTLYHPDGGLYETAEFAEFLGVSEGTADGLAETVWDRFEGLASHQSSCECAFELKA